jgi:hypothetical protein
MPSFLHAFVADVEIRKHGVLSNSSGYAFVVFL